MPNAHYISRGRGGLGIEQNIVTLCWKCHNEFDNGCNREEYRIMIEKYLKACYKNWNEQNLYYHKGE